MSTPKIAILSQTIVEENTNNKMSTRENALMIQLGRVLGGVGGLVGDIPTTYIQLAGAGSINIHNSFMDKSNHFVFLCSRTRSFKNHWM